MKKPLKVDSHEPLGSPDPGRSRLVLIVLCLYWVGIFILSHIPKEQVPKGWYVSGAAVHALAYSVLTMLIFLAAGLFYQVSLRAKKTWLIVGLVAVYATMDELLQMKVHGRDADIKDWAVDMFACLGCVVLLYYWNKRRRKKGMGKEV